jgi:hypothetical protein
MIQRAKHFRLADDLIIFNLSALHELSGEELTIALTADFQTSP